MNIHLIYTLFFPYHFLIIPLIPFNVGVATPCDTHCVKSIRIRSYSGPYFPAFALICKICNSLLNIFWCFTSSLYSQPDVTCNPFLYWLNDTCCFSFIMETSKLGKITKYLNIPRSSIKGSVQKTSAYHLSMPCPSFL